MRPLYQRLRYTALARRPGPGLGGTEVLRAADAQLAGHLMHAGRRVPEPGRNLAGREPVNEVRAHRLVATLRRLGRLKEIRRSDPHTSTALPEQHPQSVERLSDSTARPTPLTASTPHESLHFRLTISHSGQRAITNDSPQTRQSFR